MTKTKDIVIIGSGGFAKEVAFLIDEVNRNEASWNLLGFIDREPGAQNGKYTIFADDDWLVNTNTALHVVIGVGKPELIHALYQKIKHNKHLRFPNLIHPNAIGDWDRIELGQGNIICASNTFTTDIKIGSFNVLNLDCTIGHDSNIGSFNVINPSVNVSGGVQIGDEILVGTGASILQSLVIHSGSVIGAGAVLTKNTTAPGTYVGIPAKLLKVKQ